MPCSCGGMRRSGLAPNIAIRQKYPTPNIQQYYNPPPFQTQRPIQPQPQPQLQPAILQSNRPNFSANLPSSRRR